MRKQMHAYAVGMRRRWFVRPSGRKLRLGMLAFSFNIKKNYLQGRKYDLGSVSPDGSVLVQGGPATWKYGKTTA